MPKGDTAKACIKLIVQAGKGAFSESQAKALLDDQRRMVRAMNKEGKLDVASNDLKKNLREANAMHLLEKREAALWRKQMAVQDTIKSLNNKELVRMADDPVEALMGMTGGSIHPGKGTRFSADFDMKALFGILDSRIGNALDKIGLLEVWEADALKLEVAKEVSELNKTGGKPGISGNEDALKIAKVVQPVLEDTRLMLNRHGARISKLDSWYMKQSHNPQAIRRAAWWGDKWYSLRNWKMPSEDESFKAWQDDIINVFGLNVEKTYGKHLTRAEVDKAMREDWVQFAAGKHLVGEGADEAFGGGLGIAGRVSKSRSYQFNSVDGSMGYNDKYGTGSFSESVRSHLRHSARNIVLLDRFGTKPREHFEKLIKEVSNDYLAEGNLAKSKAVTDSEKRLLQIFANVDGTASIPGNIGRAKFFGTLRISQVVAKLGAMMPHSASDIPMMAEELTRIGVQRSEAYPALIENIYKGKSDKEARAMARAHALAWNSIHSDALQRITTGDHVPAAFSWMAKKLMKVNLMNKFDDAGQQAFNIIFVHKLATEADKPFTHIDAGLRTLMEQQNITPAHWELMRHTAYEVADGTKVLTADGAHEISADTIAQAIKAEGGNPTLKNILIYRDRLERNFTAFVLDRAHFGVPRPGAVENAMFNRGLPPGDWARELIETALLFKKFTATYARKGLGSRIFENKPLGAKTAGIASLIAGVTVANYLGYAFTDVAQGKKPRPFWTPKGIADAFVKGGGAAFAGDALFGERSKYSGNTLLKYAAGPVLGQADDLDEVFQRWRKGDDAAAQMVKIGQRNVPFSNLPFYKIASDYLFWWHVQDAMNPGSLERSEKEMMTREERQYFEPVQQARENIQ